MKLISNLLTLSQILLKKGEGIELSAKFLLVKKA